MSFNLTVWMIYRQRCAYGSLRVFYEVPDSKKVTDCVLFNWLISHHKSFLKEIVSGFSTTKPPIVLPALLVLKKSWHAQSLNPVYWELGEIVMQMTFPRCLLRQMLRKWCNRLIFVLFLRFGRKTKRWRRRRRRKLVVRRHLIHRKDYISRVPDDVLLIILSQLTLKEAAYGPFNFDFHAWSIIWVISFWLGAYVMVRYALGIVLLTIFAIYVGLNVDGKEEVFQSKLWFLDSIASFLRCLGMGDRVVRWAFVKNGITIALRDWVT